MSKITKKQKKLQELLADFTQPVSGREALTKLQCKNRSSPYKRTAGKTKRTNSVDGRKKRTFAKRRNSNGTRA